MSLTAFGPEPAALRRSLADLRGVAVEPRGGNHGVSDRRCVLTFLALGLVVILVVVVAFLFGSPKNPCLPSWRRSLPCRAARYPQTPVQVLFATLETALWLGPAS